MDGIASDQNHHTEQDDDDLVELFSTHLTNKVHVDSDALDGVKHGFRNVIMRVI